MENINLKDYFRIDDSHSSVRGFVVCRQPNGKILFAKENMIVKSGRSLMFNKNIGSEGTDTFNLSKLKPFLGTNSSVTTPDMEFGSLEGTIYTGKKDEPLAIEISKSGTVIEKIKVDKLEEKKRYIFIKGTNEEEFTYDPDLQYLAKSNENYSVRKWSDGFFGNDCYKKIEITTDSEFIVDSESGTSEKILIKSEVGEFNEFNLKDNTVYYYYDEDEALYKKIEKINFNEETEYFKKVRVQVGGSEYDDFQPVDSSTVKNELENPNGGTYYYRPSNGGFELLPRTTASKYSNIYRIVEWVDRDEELGYPYPSLEDVYSEDDSLQQELIYRYEISVSTEENSYSVSSLGLYLPAVTNSETDETKASGTLFSRVVFPKYTISPNTNVTFTYYLYF